VYDSLVRAGVVVVQEPGYEPRGKSARYFDPDGNIASITEAK
jgi:hypothetical protein